MVINKKISRTIFGNKSQYIGSLVLIVISCLLYTMLNLLSSNMGGMTSSFEEKYAQDDAVFTAGTLNDVPQLESKFGATIEQGGCFDYAVSSGKTLRIFSQNTKVDIPAIIEGQNLSGNDILIDPSYAKANGLKVGGDIQIAGKDLKISGFMSLPNYIYPLKNDRDIINDPNSFGLAVISKDDFSTINQGQSFYSIRFDSRDSIDSQKSQFKDYLKGQNVILSQWTDIGDNPRVTYVTLKMQGISEISSAVPIMILLLTCVLAGIVIWRLLSRESVIIGTLYALGYRKKEIMGHYIKYPLYIAIAGGVIGTAFGILFFNPMLKFMTSYFIIPIGSVIIDPVYIAMSLLLPVVFLCVSGYLVLSKKLKSSPVDLMKGAKEKTKVNFIERSLKLDRLKFPAKFRLREQLRSISRLVFLFAGVVIATMLLLFGFTAKSSLDSFLNVSIKDTYKFQFENVYNSIQQQSAPAGAEPFNVSTFTLKSDSKTDFEIIGLDPGSKFISLKNGTGQEMDKNQVIITKPLAAKLSVSPGDTVQVLNKLDSREYSVTVASIAQTYIGSYIFMPLAQFDNMFGLPENSYVGLWSVSKLDIPAQMLYSSSTVDETINDFNASLQPIEQAIGVMAFMSFIIGLVIIYVVTSLIIDENRGSISLMKVFGYRRREVNSLILNSSAVVIVLGYIAGIPLILASLSAMLSSLTESVNLTLPVTVSYPYIIAGFVIIYITYELSKALSRRKISRIQMSDALKAGTE